ncbi:MAG: tetratricopeptide repeat protein [Trueperaceae bacterium]|nr:tetratricopeptide repeat protein [Trueperaceae bacterium]
MPKTPPQHDSVARQPRCLLRVSLLIALLGAGALAAQVGAPQTGRPETRSFGEMEQLLAQGFYALAAQVEGPRLVESFPEAAEAHYLYARALYLTGDVATAQAELDVATALKGGVAARYEQLAGLLAAARGERAAAQAHLRAAWGLEPSSYSIAMDLGRVAWQAGDYDTALAAYRAAADTEVGSSQPWPLLNGARLLLYQGRPQSAIDLLEQTLDLLDATALDTTSLDTTSGDAAAQSPALPSPAYTEAFYRLGQAYEALGDLEQARSNYEAASFADPTYEPARTARERLTPGPSRP